MIILLVLLLSKRSPSKYLSHINPFNSSYTLLRSQERLQNSIWPLNPYHIIVINKYHAFNSSMRVYPTLVFCFLQASPLSFFLLILPFVFLLVNSTNCLQSSMRYVGNLLVWLYNEKWIACYPCYNALAAKHMIKTRQRMREMYKKISI